MLLLLAYLWSFDPSSSTHTSTILLGVYGIIVFLNATNYKYIYISYILKAAIHKWTGMNNMFVWHFLFPLCPFVSGHITMLLLSLVFYFYFYSTNAPVWWSVITVVPLTFVFFALFVLFRWCLYRRDYYYPFAHDFYVFCFMPHVCCWLMFHISYLYVLCNWVFCSFSIPTYSPLLCMCDWMSIWLLCSSFDSIVYLVVWVSIFILLYWVPFIWLVWLFFGVTLSGEGIGCLMGGVRGRVLNCGCWAPIVWIWLQNPFVLLYS